MKKSVVTGGNGFIGSHMCRYLCEKGHEVLVIDNHSTSPKEPVHSFGTFHNLDIADSKVVEILKKFQPHNLFHFAGLASVPESEREPLLYFKENVIKSISLINSCISAEVPNIIFSSTCATFGTPSSDTIDEKHPQLPINTYGKTKLIIERVLKDLCEKDLICAAILRYFNAAGSSEDGVIGEHNLKGDRIIPNLCQSLKKSHPFHIFGDNYPTKDGTCVRDYIHVLDLAKAHFLAAEYLENNNGYCDFNLGTEDGFSVRQVLACFEKISNSKMDVIVSPPRDGDPPSLIANSTKAKKLLQFTPKYSLDQCIEHALIFNRR